MRKPPKMLLIRGFTIRLLGLAVICIAPWINFISSGELQQDIDLPMYFALIIGLTCYITGIWMKAHAERRPSTMIEQLPSQIFWIILFSFGCIGAFLVGSIYY